MTGNRSATAWAPASLSNLGPGFDALGAAIDGLGDTVRAEETPGETITVSFDPEGAWVGPVDPKSNTAAVAAGHVAASLGYGGGLHLTIRKGLAAGTGLGSSAASSVAAAVATEQLLGGALSQEDMMAAVVAGEAATSGQAHADNVLPSLLGGFVLMRSIHPADHVRMEGWDDLGLIIVLPKAEVMTREARKALPDMVPLSRAVDHAARLAMLAGALQRRDVRSLGRWMMSDDLVIPARHHLWPYLDEVTDAALESGAAGCTISGSGPAIVACYDRTKAGLRESLQAALSAALRSAGLEGGVSIHRIHNHGALILDDEGVVSWRTGDPVLLPNR
jgi:homoserine kinase